MSLRQEKESREERDLAPYAMRSAQSRGRKHRESEDNFRTIFERDRDRIVHSSAFRRLEYKTQVFVNQEGDYYRTRLTHTLEVVQVARSLAGALRLNESLAEAIAHAHDLGHPPFGHAGEETLDELMRAHGGFRHNRQVLRILDLLEKRSPAYDGLNISYEVRESLLKAEKAEAPEAAEFAPTRQYLLEEQVVDLADSTAYNHHDVDDGLKAGILEETQLDELRLWQRARRDAKENYPGLTGPLRRRRIINSMFGLCIHDLIDATRARIAAMGLRSPEDARNAERPAVGHSEEIEDEVAELQHFLFENFYRHFRVNRMMTKCRRVLAELFAAYLENPGALPTEWQGWSEKAGKHRAVCDYLAGMTDRYALDEHKRLFDPEAKG